MFTNVRYVCKYIKYDVYKYNTGVTHTKSSPHITITAVNNFMLLYAEYVDKTHFNQRSIYVVNSRLLPAIHHNQYTRLCHI